MQQLLSIWTALDPRKRVIVAVATLAMFTGVLALSRIATTPGMTLLYAGLESTAAGDVVAALEQRGEVYEVRGGAIFVASSSRDELRMTLASEGLPANNGSGYELLEALSGFGTTSQMFDATYLRAKEGELARTIVTSPHIRSARVHISSPNNQPFKKDIRSTASVTVTTTGTSLTQAQAKAMKYLVASAVAGMSPDDVSIIDGDGGLVTSSDEISGDARTGDDRAAHLKQKVENLLSARVGPGKSVVEVSVETITESESITERKVDPESRIAISTDTEERTNKSNDAGAGSVTVASNLPAGAASSGDQSSSSQNSETRERINFEVSEIKRELVKVPGATKRLTVAVLVDGITTVDTTGTEVWTPRSDEEMAILQELVSSAIGFDEKRGDIVTLKSLAFQPVIELGTQATSSFMDGVHFDLMTMIQLSVLAIVTLVLGLFVVRPILGNPKPARLAEAVIPLPDRPARLPATGSATALSGEIDDNPTLFTSMQDVSPRSNGSATAPDLSAKQTALASDPVMRLRQLIEDRQEETVEILRGWMEEKEGRI
ncbi:flagellar basal-body MS-ring/collar protein FliF [Pseudogemmobacter sp. W21_MBD1_M6]|uniref:flagellar basal-body MS-ring/collar protein FliF n=1 Tax=Pseudogemmobacter sp. W21_MBD1_M6 TaxID=3240271 RepID=UPI003F981973